MRSPHHESDYTDRIYANRLQPFLPLSREGESARPRNYRVSHEGSQRDVYTVARALQMHIKRLLACNIASGNGTLSPYALARLMKTPRTPREEATLHVESGSDLLHGGSHQAVFWARTLAWGVWISVAIRIATAQGMLG
jgi:hypothetical protein